jgi:poly-beta-1,6-N-acetyl-D-glucosamine synthase
MLYTEADLDGREGVRKLYVPLTIASATAAVMAPKAGKGLQEVNDPDDDRDDEIVDAELVSDLEVAETRAKTIIAVIPARNEETTIVACITSLLEQERPLDGIVVVVNNSTDRTEKLAVEAFEGDPRVQILVMKKNADKKVGALRCGWQAITQTLAAKGMELDYLMGVDGDTVVSADSVGALEGEMNANSKLGGLSAKYTFDPKLGRTSGERLLIRMQRLEFASSGLDTIYRNRFTYVLGGQATLFRVKAMMAVAERQNLHSPWDPDDEVEDMGLTWNMKELGWETKVSATARAYAGPMFDIRSLYSQRRKWDFGTLKLLFRTKPWVASQVWALQVRNMLDVTVRVGFAFLLTISLVLRIYTWSWWWVIPPAVAMMLNWKIARKVPNRTFLDTFLAVILLPVEMYLVFRLVIWSVSLFRVITGSRKDLWMSQYQSEERTGR